MDNDNQSKQTIQTDSEAVTLNGESAEVPPSSTVAAAESASTAKKQEKAKKQKKA